jgi:hypothetical protein
LYDDVCLIVSHPADLPPGAVVSCPADFGLTYRGVFYLRRATLALFWYVASGCNGLSLSVGKDQTGYCDRAAIMLPWRSSCGSSLKRWGPRNSCTPWQSISWPAPNGTHTAPDAAEICENNVRYLAHWPVVTEHAEGHSTYLPGHGDDPRIKRKTRPCLMPAEGAFSLG